MSHLRESRPGGNGAASKTVTTTDSSKSIPIDSDFDFDQRVVSQMDKGIWEALFDGDFRLAVRCEICGRWLVASASKKARRGAHCAAKAGDDK
jgi:hypothetical protein